MKHIFYLLIFLIFCSCEDAVMDVPNPVEGEPVEVVLRFGAHSPIQTTVTSRTTMPNVADESRIYNMYVYVFNSAGKKIYGHYFDGSTNLYSTVDELLDSGEHGWYVHQPSRPSKQDVWGLVKFKTSATTSATIFVITNIDSRMVNVSAEKLGLVQTQEDLLTMTATLNHDFVERTGYFPMTGYLENVNTATINHTSSTTDANSMKLVRMDAKVQFWVKKGNSAIQKLELNNWKIVNVSRGSYLMDQAARKKLGGPLDPSTISGFFETDWATHEGDKMDTDNQTEMLGFSFYLLDNAFKAKTEPATSWEYKHREEQNKNVDGTNGTWKYAPDNATYVIINATIVMNTEYDFDGDGHYDIEESKAILNADVQYVIHLGDFKASFSNFETWRNTVYTYTVTVNGANDIKVEVETTSDDNPDNNKEDAPGATGEVTISLQEIFECDAHYETRVIEFDQKYIKADDVTWYVRTPFTNDRNEPVYDASGTPITTGLDFRWVEFRLNNLDNGKYKTNKRLYKPHRFARAYEKGNSEGIPLNPDGSAFPEGTGYVDELVEFLRKEKRKCKYKSNGDYDYDASKANGCAFDSEGKIRVTAFVNEFYYERHPISGEWIDQDNTLWRRFINRDEPRMMNILSDTKTSKDQESKLIGAAYSIRQKSIQSIYDQNILSLSSAWGSEHANEQEGTMYYNYTHSTSIYSENRGNNSLTNGRLNTLYEWGLVNGKTFVTNIDWEKFLNLQQANNIEILKDDYKKLRYACMTRNRDNNGNGKIDADEVRWYMASISQLIGLWMGSDGIISSARLYTRNAAQRASSDPDQWRQHVISSTSNNNNSNNPQLIWAEEGCSTGNIENSIRWAGSGWHGRTGYSIRCVRNLNMDDNDEVTNVPQDFVRIYDEHGNAEGTEDFNKDGVKKFVFDVAFLNERAYRLPVGTSDNPYEPKDLVMGDENSAMNRLYERFQVYDASQDLTNLGNFETMNKNVTTPLDPADPNPYCPEGYRLPNQREMAMMTIYLQKYNFLSGTIMTRTSYSFGSTTLGGTGKDPTKLGFSWQDVLFLSNKDHTATTARCVKDLLPGEFD